MGLGRRHFAWCRAALEARNVAAMARHRNDVRSGAQFMRRALLITALVACFAPLSFADENDAPSVDAPAPVGEWVGRVSWNEPDVFYSWLINPDGTFSSDRVGRAHRGGGAWSANGAHVTLKYDDGFRYEGELGRNSYSGFAYVADGRRLGSFAMWRDMKRPASNPDE